MSESLDHLCEQAGIQTGYHDIWGARHEASAATRAALLDAIGVDTDRADTLPLPPVTVARAGQAGPIPVRLAEQATAELHEWRVTLENGERRGGAFRPSELGAAAGDDGLVAFTLPLPAFDEIGYHRLSLHRKNEEVAATTLIICPLTAYVPQSFDDGQRLWGLAVQLYGLRSQRNWGLGDFSDLGRAIDWAADAGAGLVGVNPLHALFPHNPAHCSPYSPSSRQFINILHIDVEAVPELAGCAEAQEAIAAAGFQDRLERLRGAELIDYNGVAEAKLDVLALLYRHFRAAHLDQGSERARSFRTYQAEGGEELRLFALYHVLLQHFYDQDRDCWGWPVWPEAFRDHDSPEVAAFAEQHVADVEWHIWLQWLADEQMAALARAAEARGMAVGLYQDLAVGVDKGGAEAWKHRDLYALDCRIGCPPDDFNLLGQDWGLPPWIPRKLKAAGYAPYIAMLRANMKHAGALRIDHVMGLMRLYWIPPGMKGDAGAYVAYPFQDLLGILALESHRNRCLIVGEDLGTVPDEVRHALGDMGVLTYRLFYFERQQDGHFMPPGWYPRQALVAATTHDLPTLAGYWKGRDIEVRTELDLFPSDEVRGSQIMGRIADRARLLECLAREGLLPEGVSANPDEVPEFTPELIRAVQRYIGRSQAYIALLQAEDMLGQLEQANLPGTVDEHPNWRRKLYLALEQWRNAPNCRMAGEAMAGERGRR